MLPTKESWTPEMQFQPGYLSTIHFQRDRGRLATWQGSHFLDPSDNYIETSLFENRLPPLSDVHSSMAQRQNTGGWQQRLLALPERVNRSAKSDCGYLYQTVGEVS